MNPNERKALAACLCEDCGGLTKLPDVTLPAPLLRWCICVYEDIEEKPREAMGFGVKAKKGSD